MPFPEALLTATASLRVAFEASFDCLFIKDRHLRYVLVNPALAHLFGKPADHFPGKTDALLYGEEKAAETKRLESRVLRGETIHSELETTVGDRHLTLLLRELPLRDQAGTIVGLCGIARDISHHRKTTRGNAAARDHLRTVFEDAPDAHFLTDTRGNFLDCNKAAQRLCGYSRQQLVGSDPVQRQLLPLLESRRAARLLLRSASGHSTGPDEFTIVRKGDTKAIVEVRTFPVRMGNRDIVLWIARDLTELRRVEVHRNNLAAAIDEVAEAIVLADPSGAIEYVNSAFTARTGFSLEDAQGRCISFPANGGEDDLSVGRLRQAVRRKKRWIGRLETDKKDGTPLMEEWTLMPVRDDSGMLTGFAAIRRAINGEETTTR